MAVRQWREHHGRCIWPIARAPVIHLELVRVHRLTHFQQKVSELRFVAEGVSLWTTPALRLQRQMGTRKRTLSKWFFTHVRLRLEAINATT